MPTQLPALARRLLTCLPLLFGVAAASAQQPSWQQPREDAYRPEGEAPRYAAPAEEGPGPARLRRDDAYRGDRNDDAYRPPRTANDAYSPPRASGDTYSPPPPRSAYGQPYPPPSAPAYGEAYSVPPRRTFGEPYTPAPGQGYGEPPVYRGYGPPTAERDYGPPGPRYDPRYDDEAPDGSYSTREILAAGHGFFGSVSKGLASVIEYAFQQQGRPNGYILGQDAGGAFVAGLRYGEGMLYTKDAGVHRVYWQGPSIGYDAGAEGSKVMVLVYNLRDPAEVYQRFGGVDGSAYLVGGVGVTFLKSGPVIVAPIRSGVGLRLGASIGYLKYTRRPTWNPF